MNVVIYARFSSLSQTEQSIEGQLKVCYEYAEQNHYAVIGEYIDRAVSGKYDNRAEFQRMISDSDKHAFEGIWFISLTDLPVTATTALSTNQSLKRTVSECCRQEKTSPTTHPVFSSKVC